MTQYYRINCGHVAVDKGAVYPASALCDIAEMVDQQIGWGDYWGQDYLLVPEKPEDKKLLEELLDDAKLVWEIVDKLPPCQREPFQLNTKKVTA